MSIPELIEKLRELGFEIKSQDNDWLWLLQKETEEYIAQLSILRRCTGCER